MRTKIPGSSGTKGPSRNTSKIPWRRFRAPKWRFRGLRTRRKPKICGASSSSSDRTARRNEQFSSRFILIIESVVDWIEVDDHAIRIIGDEAILEQVIVGSTKTAPGVRSFVPKWRARRDSNLSLLKNPFGLRIGWQVKITTDDIDDISSVEENIGHSCESGSMHGLWVPVYSSDTIVNRNDPPRRNRCAGSVTRNSSRCATFVAMVRTESAGGSRPPAIPAPQALLMSVARDRHLTSSKKYKDNVNGCASRTTKASRCIGRATSLERPYQAHPQTALDAYGRGSGEGAESAGAVRRPAHGQRAGNSI